MLVKVAAALVLGQLLPGLAVAELLRLGKCREDRLVLAAVLGGPLAALVYFLALALAAPPVYGIVLAILDVAAVALLIGRRASLDWAWPGRSRLALAAIAAAVLAPYLVTTGSLYRLDGSGSLLVDRALQRDALFHLGIIRSLETSSSPRLLSVSGAPVGYHAGYHLQIAAWSRFWGIEPMDGLIRVGAPWHVTLLILSAYLLARRLGSEERERLLFALLVLASGLGFLFYARPSVDWWSLTFMDVTLVSVFLANPLLPALPLLFTGLAVLRDYLSEGGLSNLAGLSLSLGSLFVVKMFTGAHVLAALGLAAFFGAGRRCWEAFAALVLVSSPLLAHTFFAAEGSNTAVTVRPLEVVRYSMEKIDWQRAVDALASVGGLELHTADGLVVVGAVLLWIVGFLGLRLLGVPGLVADMKASSPLAWFAVIGFPLTLLFRVAPAEASGLSRLEAQNDVVWFAAESGILLWWWTAAALGRHRLAPALTAVALLGLPATMQHFVHAASLPPDRIGPARIEAAAEAERLSPPDAIWLEPLERSRPSLLPYVAGRAVVYDPYVGYDYMFFGREAVDFRRHAVAQFWSSDDEAFQAWVLERFDVAFVWREAVAETAKGLLAPVYQNDAVTLYQVRRVAVAGARARRIETPRRIPLGGRGHPYISSGLRPAERLWSIGATPSTLYVPRDSGEPLDLILDWRASREPGRLLVGGVALAVEAGEERAVFSLPATAEDGLFALELAWNGAAPLDVVAVSLSLDGRNPAHPR